MKRKTWGWILIALPFIGLALTIILFAISNAVISAQLVNEASAATVIVQADAPRTFSPTAPTTDSPLLSPSDDTSLAATPDLRATVGNGLNVLLGFLGILSVLGMFVLVPIGIYLLSTDGKKKQ